MPRISRPIEPQHLQCEVCLKEIPASVALNYEGPDYILHFCGLECIDRWKREKQVPKGNRRL